MSTKVFAMAVPSAAPDDAIVPFFPYDYERSAGLNDGSRWESIYVDVEPAGHTLRHVRAYGIKGGAQWAGQRATDTFLLAFLKFAKVGAVTIHHDDQHGVFLFEKWDYRDATAEENHEQWVDSMRVLSILSDGPYVAAGIGVLAVDYVQRRFTHDELRALHERDFESLAPSERDAVERWEDAVTVGLRQVCPNDPPKRYLGAAWESATTYQVVARGHAIAPVRASRPPLWECTPFLFYEVPDDVGGFYNRWREAGLEERVF